ncbi:molecular chaperone GrpE [Caldanaerobius fijiensis DSM 17918]|uniref:Protein GrpE n=1 Tax=Caldanaerobius fijiensis DSM 17918 TaxID=1121256 RepID=A0A1M4SFA6_9THEO|nr:nucleotide exchange factor GrpE [Caldanaerobius fijiensis]SHE30852.1 molecular chaperone GrpE [Caldanaerobius fijiensis DSM 17918]
MEKQEEKKQEEIENKEIENNEVEDSINQDEPNTEEIKEETIEATMKDTPVNDEQDKNEAEDIQKLKEELYEKTRQADEYLDIARRVQAEFDNFRKRTQKEKENLIKYANEQLILAILPVLDNLERAAAVEVNEANKSIVDGVNMVINQFKKVLSDFDVKEIEAEGKQFDPYKHHAVMQVEDSGLEPNTVVEVLQKGYELNDRVIRPSLVKVAK